MSQLQARAAGINKENHKADCLAYDCSKRADCVELVQAILHAADLSAQSMPPSVAYKFGQGVIEEFHNQFLRERREKLPESGFMKDLHKPLAQAKAQLGFLQYVVAPLWQAFSMVSAVKRSVRGCGIYLMPIFEFFPCNFSSMSILRRPLSW